MVLKDAISGLVSMRLPRWGEGASPSRRKGGGIADDKGRESVRVRPIESPARSPMTDVERLVLDILKEKGENNFDGLSQEVARGIYLDELRRGAAILDIGLLGPGLFLAEVAREIRAGDGELWEIRREG